MAESQYNADSACDPYTCPHPLMLPGAARSDAAWPIADDGDCSVPHPVMPVSLMVLATARFSRITLHS